MSFIRNIKDFKKDNDSVYGLSGKGYFYEVQNPFDLEILSGYTGTGNSKNLSENWEKIKTSPEDIISISGERTYLYPNDFDGFVECRPLKSKHSELWNKMVSDSDIKKIGITPSGSRPLLMSERRELSLKRGL